MNNVEILKGYIELKRRMNSAFERGVIVAFEQKKHRHLLLQVKHLTSIVILSDDLRCLYVEDDDDECPLSVMNFIEEKFSSESVMQMSELIEFDSKKDALKWLLEGNKIQNI